MFMQVFVVWKFRKKLHSDTCFTLKVFLAPNVSRLARHCSLVMKEQHKVTVLDLCQDENSVQGF